MFTPTGFSLEIFKDRYSFTPEETWDQACERVSKQMALAEIPEKQKTYQQKFNDILVNNLFVPGGRIWYNSGRNNPQLLNCFVLTNQLDSKEGWGNLAKEMIVTSMTGGGCGIDFSDVRPRGATINGQKGECPGPVELMKLIDGCAKPVRAGGQRRVALMFSLDLDHPDIMEFLDAKLEKGMLTHANVSVRSKNTKAFIKAVREDLNWDLSWKGKYKKSVKAKELWQKIVKNAYQSAEPGFLNWELVENENNISYETNLVTTNPCVSGDTLILTRNGYHRIDSLVEKSVDIWNGFEWSTVVPKVTGYNQNMVNVVLSNGRTLRCTEYHKFVIAGNEEIKAKDLQPGMKLIKHDFPVIETGKEIPNAYLQGFYSAEGMEGYNFLYVYEPKQICLDERLRGFGGHIKPEPNFNRTKFTFNCKLESKAYVPFEGNLKSKLDWLSGLFDGDGTELKEGGLQLWSVDREFLSNVQLLLTTLGVHSKVVIGKKEQTKEMPGGTYTCKESYRICIGSHSIQTLKKLGLSCIRLKFNKEPNRDASQFITIVDVTESGKDEVVYCFNEPKNHTGIFNGILTAQCGEIALSSYDCCCLGHLVLPRFITNDDIDYAKLGDTIRTAVRFLDNVLTVNSFPLQEMKEKSHKLRRIGLGTTGLADTLAILGFKYGSEEGNKFIDRLYRFISKIAYEASVMLAIEKGMFPACNPDKHVESGFMKRMPAKIKSLVKEHGIRNCAILTQAPTGTVSILSGNCSSGIEPMFAPVYERRFWKNNERQVELVFHPLFEQFMKQGKDVSHFVGSHNLTVDQHMEVQRIVQKHIDNAVSKTINMPHDYPIENMENLWLDYLPNLKGTTFYRDGSRGFVNEQGQVQEPPLKPISLDEAKVRFNEMHQVNSQQTIECPSGVCEI
jgi:ribonucleoside-diphosphate reductase alpha chain